MTLKVSHFFTKMYVPRASFNIELYEGVMGATFKTLIDGSNVMKVIFILYLALNLKMLQNLRFSRNMLLLRWFVRSFHVKDRITKTVKYISEFSTTVKSPNISIPSFPFDSSTFVLQVSNFIKFSKNQNNQNEK